MLLSVLPMSHYTYISVNSKSTDLAFSSVADLNAALRPTAIGELLEYNVVQDDFIKLSSQGNLEFWDRESESYQPRVNVWACVGPEELKVIANHITKGKLLLSLEHEGQSPELHMLEPKKAKLFKVPEITL